MKNVHAMSRGLRLLGGTLAAALLAGSAVAQTDRSRAQLMQLQQQVQKLQQENTRLTAELQPLKAQAEDAQKLKVDVAASKQQLARLAANAFAGQQAQLRSAQAAEQANQELARSHAEAEQLKAELAKRARTIQQTQAAFEQARRLADNERSVLGSRLALASTRADWCEAQHAKALSLGGELVGLIEGEGASARSERFTGLVRVREEQRVQVWRDRLFDARLDAPPPAQAASEPARP